jgi:hypothetical protein
MTTTFWLVVGLVICGAALYLMTQVGKDRDK